MDGYSNSLNNQTVEIDAGIKGILAIIMAIVSCYCSDGWDLLYFGIYLVSITVLLKNDPRFVLKNLASYGLVFVFPYLCGLLLSLLVSKLVPGTIYITNLTFDTAIFKMVKLFFIWYIGSLYFFTTPFLSIAEMLNQAFLPLNYLGIPIAKHLRMVTCIVEQLTKSVQQFQQDIMEQVRPIFKNKQLGIKTKFAELAGILADFIANSLQQTDQIQNEFDQSGIGVCHYRLTVSKIEMLAILSSVVFLALFFIYL